MAQVWERTFDLGYPDQIGRSIAEAPNGNYVLTGNTRDVFNPENNKAFIISTNAEGDSLWTNFLTIDAPELPWVTKIELSADESGFYISGHSKNGTGDGTAFLIKVNLDGEQISTFVFPELDFLSDFLETSNGDLILVGGVYDPGSTALNPYIAKAIKLDASGTQIWEMEYDYASLIVSVLDGEDGHYYLGGYMESIEPHVTQIGYISKINSDGINEWTFFDPSFDHHSEKVLKRNDNNIILIGGFYEDFESNTYVLILDSEGYFINMNSFINSNTTNSDFVYCPDSDQLHSFGSVLDNGILHYQSTAIAPEGIELEITSGNSSYRTIGYGMNKNTNGDIIGTGIRVVDDRKLVFMVQSEQICTPSSSIEDIDNESFKLTISPHPVIDICKFELQQEISEDLQLSIYNSKGQLLEQRPVQGTTFYWNRKSLPSGLYLYQLQSPKQTIASGKIILD